ncbi:MAG: DUF4358 domain-containing protein [Ruminococcaceae bacterium]|nr:DUF4358 domain-containing protein [Oscillospiraceae bacterium]
MKNLTTKNIIYAVVRWAIFLAFAVLLVVFASQNKISKTPMKQVNAAVSQSIDLKKMQKGSAGTFKRLYGLDSAQFESVALYWPVSNMDAEELLIVQLKDFSQQQAVKEAIEARLATQKKSFDGYGVEQYALLTESSITDVQGNYILFVVHQDAAKADAAFRDAL